MLKVTGFEDVRIKHRLGAINREITRDAGLMERLRRETSPHGATGRGAWFSTGKRIRYGLRRGHCWPRDALNPDYPQAPPQRGVFKGSLGHECSVP